MERNLPHLFASDWVETSNYISPTGGSSANAVKFPHDRKEHGAKLRYEYESAFEKRNNENSEDTNNDRKGAYITFTSFPGIELALKSLDNAASGEAPRLLAVKHTKEGTQQATVWIPTGKKQIFLNKVNQYIQSVKSLSEGDDKKARHSTLIESIESIFRSTLLELWTDDEGKFPTTSTESCWWEVWLRRENPNSINKLAASIKRNEAKLVDRYLGIGNRIVVLINASLKQLSDIFDSIDDIAELRSPNVLIVPTLINLPRSEQQEWMKDLLERIRPAEPHSPAVCILDCGIQSHPLLQNSLAPTDKYVADPSWQHDPVKNPHGTEMAGLALFGNLDQAIISTGQINLGHRLESVKILPDNKRNEPRLYGIITAQAVDQPEIAAINKKRVFMMAITAQDSVTTESAGRPTSWSAAIDALSFGRAIKVTADHNFINLDRNDPPFPRLFIISAGNIRGNIVPDKNYQTRNDEEPIEDPAQSWNSLTVGAYSGRDDMHGADPSFDGWNTVAKRGDISPASRTSVSFENKKWPFKPEVVADGGNYAISPDNMYIDSPDNLAILTTRHQTPNNPTAGLFTSTRDTSAATAQVAAVAADIWAKYPNLRPETIRALVVHSAEWTDTMRANFDPKLHKKSELIKFLRRYGMGVPNLDRALHSAENATTLIAESRICPFEQKKDKSELKLKEINFHSLPWPIDELEQLGETIVRMRITLSYFVEPNPSNRGWRERYAYPSHGLRFGVKRPEESVEAFLKRWNKAARQETEILSKYGEEKGWLFGTKFHRSPGSLHTDIWTGTATDLASKGAIVVYPVSGWWKHHPKLDQSDMGVNYSLIVSIEAPEVDVKFWTPIRNKIETVAAINY